MSTDDIDKFGHCVICHKNLLTKRVVDGKVVDMLTPIYSDTMFLLNNGSQLPVTICKVCKAITDLKDPVVFVQVMAAVNKGWELEGKLKVETGEIDEEKRQRIFDSVKNLSIDCHSENMDRYAIQERTIALLKIKVEEDMLPAEDAVSK